MPKSWKNSDLASERLLWSSVMAYIFTARFLSPRGKTCTRHIFAQDRAGRPSPQTSVHLEVTSEGKLRCCSVCGSATGNAARDRVVSGCMVVQCSSLSHSLHFSFTGHSLAM